MKFIVHLISLVFFLQETAIQIAKSTQLFSEEQHMIILNAENQVFYNYS
jgi:hypothetical protein